jgi:hypothetical protein
MAHHLGGRLLIDKIDCIFQFNQLVSFSDR